MRFLLDNENKILFGWSAKCGCSHIKRIFWFLYKGYGIDYTIHNIHNKDEFNNLPNDIENWRTVIIGRNPYKRVISGFIDKYRINGQYRHLWKHNNISFVTFINELEKNDWIMIDEHHFIQQTGESFSMNILNSKTFRYFDLENIDYTYIEQLYNKKIPKSILNIKEGHERKIKNIDMNNYIYDLNMDEYCTYNVDYKYFYNEELKQKIYNFYKSDFDFFQKIGFEYNI